MMTSVKTIALAALMAGLSAPAFAAAHMDLSTMTCEQYNELGGAERDQVAMMAVMELNDNAVPTEGTATDTEDSVGTTQEESNMAVSEGSATDTTITNADDDLTRYAEEIRVLNRTCSRNWDATLTEAASGQFGTR